MYLKNDATKNTDDELFAKARNGLGINQITLKDVVNKFVETIQDVLKENNIPSEIKLTAPHTTEARAFRHNLVIETDGEDDGYNYNDDNNNESFNEDGEK